MIISIEEKLSKRRRGWYKKLKHVSLREQEITMQDHISKDHLDSAIKRLSSQLAFLLSKSVSCDEISWCSASSVKRFKVDLPSHLCSDMIIVTQSKSLWSLKIELCAIESSMSRNTNLYEGECAVEDATTATKRQHHGQIIIVTTNCYSHDIPAWKPCHRMYTYTASLLCVFEHVVRAKEI